MRQVGVLAAAGLLAIETMIPRLAEDHAHARLLGDALSALAGVRVAPVRTNIVVALLPRPVAPAVVGALDARDVLATAMDARTLRLVTHRDVSRADCERAASVLVETLRG
jgi:threonine aldolase